MKANFPLRFYLLAFALLAANIMAWIPPDISAWKSLASGLPPADVNITVDRTNGYLFAHPAGYGIWLSRDHGSTFERVDSNKVGASYTCGGGASFFASQDGGKLAYFANTNPSICAFSTDTGKTWTTTPTSSSPWNSGTINWDCPNILFTHGYHTPNMQYYSNNGGRTWAMPNGAAYSAAGIFAPGIIMANEGDNMYRSVDAGKTWTGVGSMPVRCTIHWFKGKAYWLSGTGVMTTPDSGITWTRVGSALPSGVDGRVGPYFGKDEGHMVVVCAYSFIETMDTGKTWYTLANIPPYMEEMHSEWGFSFAYDPVNDIIYAHCGPHTHNAEPNYAMKLELNRWDNTGKPQWPIHLDTLSLSFFANASGMVPADPVVKLINTSEPISALTVTSDSAWLHVTVSGTGLTQVMHHTADIAGLDSTRAHVTRVKVSAAGYRDTFYTVTVGIGSAKPAFLKVIPDVRVIVPAQTVQYSAQTLDACHNIVTSTATIDWTVSGGGTIDAAGLFTQSGDTGIYTVTASLHDNPAITATASLRSTNLPTGLVLDLAADAVGNVGADGRVAIWPDISGRNYHATQTFTELMPVLVPGALAGKPVLRFNGDNGLRTTLNFTSSYSIFIVMSYSASAGAIPLRAVQGSNSWYIGARDANLVFSYDGNNDAAYRGIAYNKNYYYLADVLSDGSRTFFFVNNLITTLDSTKAGAPGLVGLGTGGYAPKECAIIGDIAEVLAFSRRLTNAERLVVESYLRARWPKGTAIEDMADAAPITQADMCAAPNPFNPSISVRYALPVQTKASLTVYSISGAKVRTLTDAVHRAGRYQVQWDGRDNNRAQVAAGVYLLRLEGNNIRLQKKITYLK